MVPGVQALLKLEPLKAAVRLMEVFDSKLLSNKHNMKCMQ